MSTVSEKSFSPSKLFNPSDKIADFEIDDETRKAMCFREDLIVSLKGELNSDTKPVGGYCISIESIGPNKEEFMTQVLSSFNVNDSLAGSKVLGSTTARLHCLEEKRTEYIHRQDALDEKNLYIGLEEEIYHLEIQDSCPCDETKWKKDIPLCMSGELLSEGANVLLMRYLALKNFHGNLSFQSLMIGGQLTTCNYRCTEAQRMKFNDSLLEVYTIERRMHEECGLVNNTKTYMTRKGFILRHDWLETSYLLKINPLINPDDIGNRGTKFIPSLNSRWSSDVQMLSMYLEKKTCKMAQQVDYLKYHPEIKDLISDYAKKLLAVKPMNVLSFTIQHFASFAKNPDPSEESNLVSISQLSKNKPTRVCSICGICFDRLMASDRPVIHTEFDGEAEISRCSTENQKLSKYSLCSVFTKCPSDASCVKKLSRNSDMSAACSEDRKACENDAKRENSLCSFTPECKNTCEGCLAAREPCAINKACPECPGCHKVCSDINICPICKKCNSEILPDVGTASGCGQSDAESLKSDINYCDKD